MHWKSTSFTLTDVEDPEKSPMSTPKSIFETDDPIIVYLSNPKKYQRIQAKHLFTDNIWRDSSSTHQFPLITDYLANQNIFEINNKFKLLNTKKDALSKKPIATVPTSLELEFNKSLKKSYLSLLVPGSSQRLKRSTSMISLGTVNKRSNSKKPSSKERLHVANPINRERVQAFKKPHRFDGHSKSQSTTSNSNSNSFITENTFISSRSSSRSGKESILGNNYVTLNQLFDIIFFSDTTSKENYPPVFISPEKLRRIMLVAYESAIEPEALLEHLCNKLTEFEEKSKEKLSRWDYVKNRSSQIAILVFIRLWIQERPNDFNKGALLENVKKLIVMVALKFKASLHEALRPLKRLVEKLSAANASKSQEEKKAEGLIVSSGLTSKARTYFSQIHKELNLLSLKNIQEVFMIIPSFEIAKQFCIFDLKLVSQISLQDLKGTLKKQKDHDSPLHHSGLHFNYLTLFIIFLIIKVENKAPLVSKLIYVANNLFELRDFQGFSIIMTSLTHHLIQKVVDSIVENTDKEICQLKKALEQSFDKLNGYRNLKKTMNNSSFPMVPFVPIIAQEVLRIEAAHEQGLQKGDNGEISLNIKKLDMVFQSYESLYLSRFFAYDFEPIQIVQECLDRYFKEVLFSYTRTQGILDIEELLDSNLKAQLKAKKQK